MMTSDEFRRRMSALRTSGDLVIVGHSDSLAPRELVAPDACDHSAGWCDDDAERSECSGCGQKRNRATCGEDDEQEVALDRLDVTIRDHPMAGNARQWRLIAADLIMMLEELGPAAHDDAAAESLRYVREQHDRRTIIPKGA